MEKEDWKPVVEFPYYEVSTLGRVRSFNPLRRQAGKPWIMGTKRNVKKGKLTAIQIVFKKQGKSNVRLVHRLVLEAFVGPCPNNMECCHNDGNPGNNHLSNLRWDTRKSNMRDMVLHGTARIPKLRGSQSAMAKLTEQDVCIIKAFPKNRGYQTVLAKRFGVSQTTISQIIRGLVWAHVSISPIP